MMPEFIGQMDDAFACRQHTVLHLNTEDRFYCPEEKLGPSNLNYMLAARYSRMGYRVAQYTPSQGVRELTENGENSGTISGLSRSNDPLEVINGISRLLRNQNEKWLILVLYPETLMPGQQAGRAGSQDGLAIGEILHTLALDDGIAAGPSRLALVCYAGLPEDLITRSRGFRMLEVGLPCYQERLDFIQFLNSLAEDKSNGLAALNKELTPEEAARLTAGMPLAEIEMGYRSAAHHKKGVTRSSIRKAKARAIRNISRDLLEVTEPREGLDSVAGHKNFKSWARQFKEKIQRSDKEVPQAILLQGVPGAGKTHSANALAGDLGWVFIEPRNIRGPYVGQSEANLERFIRIIEQLTPAVIVWDEIDQALGQRGTGPSGDSGTNNRMLARIFAWLGSLHLRGQVLFVGATNRPDLLDPATLDRFGVSIPFLKPGPEEISELIPMLLKRFDRRMAAKEIENALHVIQGLSVTGRDLQEILIRAAHYADHAADKSKTPIKAEHIEKAIFNYIPREDPQELEFWALTSLALTSSQDLLPWNNEAGLRPGATIPNWLMELEVVSADGRLQKGSINQVLGRMQRAA